MPYKTPPVATRFPVNRKDHTQKHPNGYLTSLLNKFLKKKMTINDAEVKEILETESKAELGMMLVLRWILNGIQGENEAIKEIFNRVDGKINFTDITIDHQITYKEVKIIVDRRADISSARESSNGLSRPKPL